MESVDGPWEGMMIVDEDENDTIIEQLFKERYEKRIDVPGNSERPDFHRAKKELRITAQRTIVEICLHENKMLTKIGRIL